MVFRLFGIIRLFVFIVDLVKFSWGLLLYIKKVMVV